MGTFPFNTTAELARGGLAKMELSSSTTALHNEVLALFDALRVRLLRYSVSFGLSTQDAEDVVQEVFLALFRHLQLDRPRNNLQGWVFRVTHHLSLKRCQVVKRIADEPVDEYCDIAPNPEDQLLWSEQQLRMQAVLRALPEIDRYCLRLRAEGLRYRQIAEVVGISLGSVSASLARSIARLERAEANCAR
jgi:RNA polymerase sigma-70 factor (ECF subfamily)